MHSKRGSSYIVPVLYRCVFMFFGMCSESTDPCYVLPMVLHSPADTPSEICSLTVRRARMTGLGVPWSWSREWPEVAGIWGLGTCPDLLFPYPEPKFWIQARHLPEPQGCHWDGRGNLSVRKLNSISNYRLYFHQRCLMTGCRQVQFCLNQDTARTYSSFVPWAEPVLNNLVFIYLQTWSLFCLFCFSFRVMGLLIPPYVLFKTPVPPFSHSQPYPLLWLLWF